MKIHKNELFQLKNLGVASVNILHAIGIKTYEELCEAGAVEAYRRVRAHNINASKTMLYALQGAILDVHWNELPRDMKLQLVYEFEFGDYQMPHKVHA